MWPDRFKWVDPGAIGSWPIASLAMCWTHFTIAPRCRKTDGEAAQRRGCLGSVGAGVTDLELRQHSLCFSNFVQQSHRPGVLIVADHSLKRGQLVAAPSELPAGPFHVIVADPPWRYESGNSIPYPTMQISAVQGLPIHEIAAEDAVLWLGQQRHMNASWSGRMFQRTARHSCAEHWRDWMTTNTLLRSAF